MTISTSTIHDCVLFLLKDQTFDLSKDGIAAFATQYKHVYKLIAEHCDEEIQKAIPKDATRIPIVVRSSS